MDEIIRKLGSLNYDIFGIFIPGLFLIICLAGYITFDSYIFFGIGYTKSHVYLTASEGNKYLSLILAVIVSYLFGHFLKHLVNKIKGFDCNKSLIKCGKNYDPELEELYKNTKDALCKKLSLDASKVEWKSFYKLATRYIYFKNTPNLISNYQNKYTLHGSLTAVFLVLSIISVFNCAAILISSIPIELKPFWFLINLIFLFIFVLFISIFNELYKSNWTLTGNEALIVASISLMP